jgi:hypothetical protein
MSASEAEAARAERINEAGLDAADVYEQLVADEDFGIEFVRDVLKLMAQVREIKR